ncbi:hypothetical protein AHAS_Ahas03G0261800 [Arachis hypogaea]
MLRKCPQNIFCDWVQPQIFYNGLTHASRTLLDFLVGGSMHMKTTEEALELIKIMTNNQYLYSFERAMKRGVMELDTIRYTC